MASIVSEFGCSIVINPLFYEEKIKATFGLDFLDKFTEINDKQLWEHLNKAYELGFLTAFHLWMDAFSEYPLGG